MRRLLSRFSAAVALVLLLVAATATRPLLGQLDGRPAQGTSGSISEAVQPMAVTPLDQAVQGPQPNPLENPLVVRSLDFPRMAARVEGRMVAVSGQAQVHDRIPGNPYIWLLRVYPFDEEQHKRGDLAREHHYLEDAITLDEGQTQIAPTFQDLFALAPGTYHVELTLYAVPPDFSFKRVKFGEDVKKKAVAGLSRFAKVIIKD